MNSGYLLLRSGKGSNSFFTFWGSIKSRIKTFKREEISPIFFSFSFIKPIVVSINIH